MQNKITLIIPDIHHKWKQAEKIIASVGADEIIFLGDFFDDFNDTPDNVRDTCKWLESSVVKKNRIHLMGNHDMNYRFSYPKLRCSGYADWKYFIVRDTMPKWVWDAISWYHFLDDRWLLSHAGLHKLLVPSIIMESRSDRKKYIKELAEFLDTNAEKGIKSAANGEHSWIFNAGFARWGTQRVGGITWCDYSREFNPFRGMNQIMGHTPSDMGTVWHWTRISEDGNVLHPKFNEWQPTLEELDNPDLSANLCLDVYSTMHWATWNGKRLEIGSYKDL